MVIQVECKVNVYAVFIANILLDRINIPDRLIVYIQSDRMLQMKILYIFILTISIPISDFFREPWRI